MPAGVSGQPGGTDISEDGTKIELYLDQSWTKFKGQDGTAVRDGMYEGAGAFILISPYMDRTGYLRQIGTIIQNMNEVNGTHIRGTMIRILSGNSRERTS